VSDSARLHGISRALAYPLVKIRDLGIFGLVGVLP
jgi:hypothetical protein